MAHSYLFVAVDNFDSCKTLMMDFNKQYSKRQTFSCIVSETTFQIKTVKTNFNNYNF